MCCHILNQNSEVTSTSSIQRVTELEPQNQEQYKAFDEFKVVVRIKLKENRTYDGAKPNPED